MGLAGGRTPVITGDMLYIVLRSRANGETVEQIQPDPIIPIGKRKGRNPSVVSIYRALAAYEAPRHTGRHRAGPRRACPAGRHRRGDPSP
ncbi:hypothetical protein Ari01nite_83940 [Paractinoplanes rishiriensis]|uniref:Transposase n=1 Tax=Paractinoplanes rishiriensis TaxID=1050105 RepID=A0A919MZ92_9ACTN|nr:hypothetical protein Ari01nite_83940 [Actinoplanes rishiriensis]